MHNLRAWPLLLLLLGGGGCAGSLPNALRTDLSRLVPETGLFAMEEVGPDVAIEPEGRTLRLTYNGRARHAALLQELGERRLWRTGSGMVVATDGASPARPTPVWRRCWSGCIQRISKPFGAGSTMRWRAGPTGTISFASSMKAAGSPGSLRSAK